MLIILICGVRPNFMKIAPLMEALKKYTDFELLLVHTGQHYDDNLSKVFFDELGIPEPDINLGVGSGSHAWQAAEVMKKIEKIFIEKTDTLEEKAKIKGIDLNEFVQAVPHNSVITKVIG